MFWKLTNNVNPAIKFIVSFSEALSDHKATLKLLHSL